MSAHCDIVILRNKERIRYLKKKRKKKELLCYVEYFFAQWIKKIEKKYE